MTQTMPRYDRRFRNALKQLLEDDAIHPRNRELFRQFFEFQEYKLKRLNGLAKLDDGTYKTLSGYVMRFRNVNQWFHNKPWADLTREDIQRVYDGLEDGTILNRRGRPFAAKSDYYRKIMKSRPFRMAGKEQLAREVIEFTRSERQPVRFILEKQFRRLVIGVRSPRALLLFWLAFDFGENINSLLQLRPSDFHRREDPQTGDPEYRLNYRPEILKRSRRTRADFSNYPQTVQLLDEVLAGLPPDQPIFGFGYSYARKLMERTVKRSGVACQPNGEPVGFKDLRSSMACDLLNKNWSRESVNARLGHAPSSSQLDKYINYFALDKRQSKREMVASQAQLLREQLDQAQRHARVESQRSEQLASALEIQKHQMQKQMLAMKKMLITELRDEIDTARRRSMV